MGNSYVTQTESIIPIHGVVTLFGYGTSVNVERGHLILEDGIGPHRRNARFARVGHGLKRLVVIGSDGMVSFAALRWLADQKCAFVMLDRTGSMLATSGPVAPSDARLRRPKPWRTIPVLPYRLQKNWSRRKLSIKSKYSPNIFLIRPQYILSSMHALNWKTLNPVTI
ncbi:MAG TPA: hypothetical protein VKH45_01495 [Candidatus Acidoferrum sp.]|nr:hypothetical protein [Candidatus Acidoferrum sp.]